jgi:hypothetical protein
MQYFKTGSGRVFAYEDDVAIATAKDGTTTAAGTALPNVPTDLKPYTPPAPTAADKLAEAQATQIGQVSLAYRAAITANIDYTNAAGTKQTYQADDGSRSNLQDMLSAFAKSQTVPAGFFWVALDNSQVPFVYADLQGLAEALGVRGAAAFAQLQILKDKIRSATTISAVQAIVWTAPAA